MQVDWKLLFSTERAPVPQFGRWRRWNHDYPWRIHNADRSRAVCHLVLFACSRTADRSVGRVQVYGHKPRNVGYVIRYAVREE